MTIEWDEPFVESLNVPGLRGRIGVGPVPGTERVLDRNTQTFAACTPELCPFAREDGNRLVNTAPYNAFNGWSGAINAGVDHAQRLTAYRFFAYMLEPAQR